MTVFCLLLVFRVFAGDVFLNSLDNAVTGRYHQSFFAFFVYSLHFHLALLQSSVENFVGYAGVLFFSMHMKYNEIKHINIY